MTGVGQQALFTDEQWDGGAGQITSPQELPPWLRARVAAEDADEARLEALFEALHPRAGRVIVTKPIVAAASQQRVLDCGLYVPDVPSVYNREWGLRCEVLKVSDIDAEELAAEGVTVGSHIVIPEHAGHPIYLDRETPWWVISKAEIIAVMEGV